MTLEQPKSAPFDPKVLLKNLSRDRHFSPDEIRRLETKENRQGLEQEINNMWDQYQVEDTDGRHLRMTQLQDGTTGVLVYEIYEKEEGTGDFLVKTIAVGDSLEGQVKIGVVYPLQETEDNLPFFIRPTTFTKTEMKLGLAAE